MATTTTRDPILAAVAEWERREGVPDMRLILIDNGSGFIFGDTAEYLAGQSGWKDDASGDDQDLEPLALLAARLLDESIGEFGREYVFIAHNPRDTSTGYHIYRADEQGRQTLPLVDDGQDQTMIEFVMENCPYLGFVRCEATQ
jgi:hypothetical protein